MAYHCYKRIHKPGFLLIEIMCAFALMIISGSIMAFYIALGHKQQQAAQNSFSALLSASKTIDEFRNSASACNESKKNNQFFKQEPLTLFWNDGTQDQVWVITVKGGQSTGKINLQTILPQKAL